MMLAELEKKKNQRPDSSQLIRIEEDNRILENGKLKSHIIARRQEVNSYDNIKRMNQMMDYAKTVSIRDRQLIERQERMKEEKKIEEQLIIQLEIDKLKKYEELAAAEEKRRLEGMRV